MRGLEIRCLMAKAKVLRRIDPDRSVDVFCDVYNEAVAMGIADYKAGRFDAPPLFADEPNLSSWWEEGQGWQAEKDELVSSLSRCGDHSWITSGE